MEHYLVSIIHPGELTSAVKVFLVVGLTAVTILAYRAIWRVGRTDRSLGRSGMAIGLRR